MLFRLERQESQPAAIPGIHPSVGKPVHDVIRRFDKDQNANC